VRGRIRGNEREKEGDKQMNETAEAAWKLRAFISNVFI